jgi:hypothetical protein
MNREKFVQMKEAYLALGIEAFTKNHYELAKLTPFHDPIDWKEFLLTPEIADYKASEKSLIQEATIAKISMDAKDSNSVGKAQLLNALQKNQDTGTKKDGPIFIYSFVPANEQQAKAPNYRQGRKTPEGGYEFDE